MFFLQDNNINKTIIFLLSIIIILQILYFFQINHYKIIDNFADTTIISANVNTSFPVSIIPYQQAYTIWGDVRLPFDSKQSQAKWIWYCNLDSSNNAPVTNYRYSLNYLYYSNISISATIYILCDDACIIILNNNYVGTCTKGNGLNTPLVLNNNIFNINLVPGNNIFNLLVKNISSSAGVICSVGDLNNNFLFNTNSLWNYSDGLLITPNNIKNIIMNS